MEPQARALSEEAMLAGLRDIRLPASAAGGAPAEMLAALAVGLALALLAGLALRAVTARRPVARGTGLRQAVAEAAALPDETRRLALLHLLRDHAPGRHAELRAALYRPGGLPDAATLERELLR
ncbi:hypothetical protein [Roseivivax isoporae]|uniref:Uncharacterized protein n=1 Tax=Roseivivax isoporae LMG 25204 TaxID=1449351 RepID=X7F7G9_9RHOB|nr:hypothetical protein [Roseivivax isoporae]ETX28668.1 hypothetical protein RISW2_05060 [Roseivivax isoporae LMG 25204]